VQKFAHAPAQLFDVANRGFLREGYAPTVIDDTPFTVQRSDVLSNAAGRRSRAPPSIARIAATWVNGVLAWDGSALVGEPAGQRPQFDR
jgi:dihydroorotase